MERRFFRATRLLLLCALPIGCSGAIGGSGGSPGGEGEPAGPGASSGGAGAAPDLPPANLASASGLRRLTSHEYDNTLRDLLRDATRPGRAILPADARTPFDNDFTVQVASKALVDGLDLLAREAVQRLFADAARRDAVIGCVPRGPQDADCFRRFVAQFGRRALRRALAPDEVARWEQAFMPLAAESADLRGALEPALHAFLQHPELVYRVEIGTPVAGQPGLHRLGGFEVATRLSFLLWGTTPDDVLLDLAQANGLATAEGVRAAAARMLKDARAKEAAGRFHALWLGYEGMSGATAEPARSMWAETSALVNRVLFDQGRPWQDLLRSTETFLSDTLARHYGLPGPGATPRWVSYGASGRRGLLSHGTFLANGAKVGDTSPTMRGIAVRELLMCDEIPAPPPGVDADAPPPATASATCKEDRYAVHRQGGCATCHALIDPIGFGLESYDQQGRYRTREAGRPECAIRGEGELAGVGRFKGPAELSDLLLRSGRVGPCLITQLHRFAFGKSALDEGDKQAVAAFARKLAAGGADFRFDELLLQLVSAESFRHRREETAP